MAAILIMTEFSLLREVKALDAGKPPKATAKPYSRHILGIYSGVQSHTKATPKPTTQAISRLEGAETTCSPRVLAIMRIAGRMASAGQALAICVASSRHLLPIP